MVPIRDACRTSWEVSGIFLFVTESGVSHCHFQVTETSNPLSIVGPHTFEKTMGVNTLFTLHPRRAPRRWIRWATFTKTSRHHTNHW